MSPKNQVTWGVARPLHDVHLMHAQRWVSDLGYYHDGSYDLCQFDRVVGARGPVNRYRTWTEIAAPQDVFAFEPGHPHRAKGGVEASFKVLVIPAARMDRAVLEITGRPGALHFDRLKVEALYPLTEAVHRTAREEGPRAALEDAFEALLVRLVTCASPHALKVDSVDDGVAWRARQFIDDIAASPHGSLSLDELVQAVGAKGKSQLIRDFQKLMGVRPYEYFKLRRFAQARNLLECTPAMRVAHIAWDLGYTEYSFAKSFRQLHGLSPRDYRTSILRPAT